MIIKKAFAPKKKFACTKMGNSKLQRSEKG